MLYFKRLLLVLTALSVISGCSSSNSPVTSDKNTGPDTTATFTPGNAKSLAIAGAEATIEAAGTKDLSLFKSAPSSSFDSKAFAKRIVQNFYATQDISEFICTTEGSFIITTPDVIVAGDMSATAEFVDCTFTDEFSAVVIINGSMLTSGNATSFTIDANITVSVDGIEETVTFNGTCSLPSDPQQLDATCSYESTYTGVDGNTYSIADISVSGDEISGFTVNGSMTHPEHGDITITTTTPVTFNCAGDTPDAGEIVVSGHGEAIVTFDNCDQFSVTYDGVLTTYNWVDL